MFKGARLIVCAAVLAVFGLTGVCSAWDFSADMINKSKAGTFKGKIYIAKDKTRMEMGDSISISRMDKKVVWILMPVDKVYMEQPFDPKQAAPTSDTKGSEIERKLVGQDTIDGKKADKYQVTYKSPAGTVEKMFQWTVAGIEVPVKMAAVDNSWTMEYKNINTGKQPDSLFEVPAGYQKFGMGMPNVKDMMQGFGGGRE